MTSLTITRIAAENILKFEQFKLEQPDKVTLFRGPNNLGKTTALKLLSLAVKGAADPKSVIHDGAKKGEIVLDFLGYKLRRAFTEKGQYLQITDAEGRTLPRPQQWLDERIGEFRDFNPLTWLSMPPKEQVAILLRAIDVRLSDEEFVDATGMEPPIGVDFSQHGLLVLDQLRAHFAEERKVENRTADQKKKAAAEARAQLPAEKPVITPSRRDSAARARSDAAQARTRIEARQLAAKDHAASVERYERDIRRIDGDVADLDAENVRLRAQIAKNEERQKQLRADQAKLRDDLAALATSAPPTAEEIEAVNRAVRAANELTQAISADEKVISRFEAVEAIEHEANEAAASAAIIGGTIETIDTDLRTQLMAKAKLPVGALSIDGETITLDGHPLQHAAESQQIRVALAIARALNPKLKVIILDGSERLDAKTFETFLMETRGDGFKYFAAEVDRDGSALEVISFGEDGAATAAVAEVA